MIENKEIKNDLEAKCKRMLEFISKDFYCRKITENEFLLKEYLSVYKPEINKDYVYSCINFENKTIKLYSCDLSGHNGDHYNDSTVDIPWSRLIEVYENENIKSAIKSRLKEKLEVLKEQMLENEFNAKFK